MKTQIFLQAKHNISYVIISSKVLIFKIQGNVWDLSIMRISYKLTKRTKTEKIEKFLKILIMYNIINFKTFCYKLTNSDKIVYSILNYKLMRPVSILRLPKDYKKQAKNEAIEKMKKELYSKKVFTFK